MFSTELTPEKAFLKIGNLEAKIREASSQLEKLKIEKEDLSLAAIDGDEKAEKALAKIQKNYEETETLLSKLKEALQAAKRRHDEVNEKNAKQLQEKAWKEVEDLVKKRTAIHQKLDAAMKDFATHLDELSEISEQIFIRAPIKPQSCSGLLMAGTPMHHSEVIRRVQKQLRKLGVDWAWPYVSSTEVNSLPDLEPYIKETNEWILSEKR